MKKSPGKWIKIITLIFIIIWCALNASDRFDKRDTDSGIMFCLAIIAFAIAAISIYLKIKKDNASEESEEEVILPAGSIFSMFITIISLCYVTFMLLFRIGEYYDKKATNKQDKIDRINQHEKWVNEMTYKLDKLSKHDYIKAYYLVEGGTSVLYNDLKVIEINDTEVTLVKFYTKAGLPHLIAKNYNEYEAKDTITLPLKSLKQSLFKDHKIKENIRNYQDSIRGEGLFYVIKNIQYINGPHFSGKKYNDETYEYEHEPDTTYFAFQNLQKKAKLTKIVNVLGDHKWHDKLPITVNEYSDDQPLLELKTTNLDLEKGYKFELHFEDSEKKKHIFLVSQITYETRYFYRIKRVEY